MSASTYEELVTHVGHEIECVTYGKAEDIWNVAIECLDCAEVLLDFERPASSAS
jgi:hypothetical protein